MSYVKVIIPFIYLGGIAWLQQHQQILYPGLNVLPTAVENISVSEKAYWLFYWSPYVRFYDFLFGVFAALIIIRGAALPAAVGNAVALVFVAFELFWILAGTNLDKYQMLFPPFFAIFMASRAGISHRWLAVPALIFIGEISYSLYLFHPFATYYFDGQHHVPFSWLQFMIFARNFAIDLLIALALASGLHRVLEMPAQKYLRRLIRRSPPAVAVAVQEEVVAEREEVAPA